MLVRLSLEQFVIVEQGTLEFAPGLNVLTGETGAGKSILVDALGFLCGGHASSDWLRREADRMVVEGALDLHSATEIRDTVAEAAAAAGIPLDHEGLLLLRREMGRDGRSRCFANGRQILVSQLRALTGGAVWIVGQGEQRALVDSSAQEWLLDRFARAQPMRSEYQSLRRRFLELRDRLGEMDRARALFLKEEDWLRFQAHEIREAAIRPGERALLEEQRRVARSRTEDRALLNEVRQRLFEEEGSILDHLESLSHRLAQSEGERWEELRNQVRSLRETVRELRRLLPPADDEDALDPDALEERLLLLGRLCRKYGGDEESVLVHLREVEARCQAGETLEGELSTGRAEFERLRQALGQAGSALFQRRLAAAGAFAAAVEGELRHLGMDGAALRFNFSREPDQFGTDAVAMNGAASAQAFVASDPEAATSIPAGPSTVRVRPLEGGLERISLFFRSHPAELEGELGRIASGGELSRVLLAIHAALGETGPPGCWILDEVDQGIGGETALRVGERLAAMAGHAQVLLVTHLPAIAARADRHFRVAKVEEKGRPAVRVGPVEGDDRLTELARMLSGDGRSEIARRHARELLSDRKRVPRS
jgi:DNA repair protein RecN (Recombination protein N)